MTIAPARTCAFAVLQDVEVKKAYSHVALHDALRRQSLSPEDAALATEIVHGVLLWRRLLDEWIKTLTRSTKSKVTPDVMTILRIGLYQMRFLHKVPAYAAVSDAVDLAKLHNAKAAGFVNAVLRAAQRQKGYEQPLLEFSSLQGVTLTEAARRLSFPDWMARHLAKTLGDADAVEVMWGLNQKANRALRVNQLRTTREHLVADLLAKGIEASPSAVTQDGVHVTSRTAMQFLPEYEQGLYTLQGESSMMIARLLQGEPGMRILDACAAPGGKTTHIAEVTQDRAEIVAVDLHEHRAAMIKEQAKRLQLRSIQVQTMDARNSTGDFDRILLDAPCSGLGTIARKPDLKWTMTEDKIAALVSVQEDLLHTLATRVRSGGILLYTTCTLSAQENERQIGRFLDLHPEFSLLDWTADERASLHYSQKAKGMAWIYPQDFFGDGFFLARLQRR